MMEDIANGLATHKLVPFFGAGVSATHLNVLWDDLVREMADAVALPPDARTDFLRVADAYVDALGQASLATLLTKHLIVDQFDDVKGWPHLFLLSLGTGTLYTTNQDNLFELASAKKGRPHRIIARLQDLAEARPSEHLLIKYHGDLSHPETVIFTGSSYRARIADTRHFLNIRMQADLLAKGFLFVGYSFRDPNIHLLFQELRAAFGATLPPSYLIAYRYDPSMEDLNREFGVTIVDPSAAFTNASTHDEAFKRYLKALSERVLELKASQETSSWLSPQIPPSVRVATEYDIAAVVDAANNKSFADGLQTYRSLLDRTMIPNGLEKNVLSAFMKLCAAARNNGDLSALAAAVFNLSLPPPQALEAICELMVAINRVNPADPYPEFMINSPQHGDRIIPLAAAAAVAKIKRENGIIQQSFRWHADVWMLAFPKLSPEHRALVKEMMEIAWRDGGSPPPDRLFNRTGLFRVKTFEETRADIEGLLPRMLKRPPTE